MINLDNCFNISQESIQSYPNALNLVVIGWDMTEIQRERGANSTPFPRVCKLFDPMWNRFKIKIKIFFIGNILFL